MLRHAVKSTTILSNSTTSSAVTPQNTVSNSTSSTTTMLSSLRNIPSLQTNGPTVQTPLPASPSSSSSINTASSTSKTKKRKASTEGPTKKSSSQKKKPKNYAIAITDEKIIASEEGPIPITIDGKKTHLNVYLLDKSKRRVLSMKQIILGGTAHSGKNTAEKKQQRSKISAGIKRCIESLNIPEETFIRAKSNIPDLKGTSNQAPVYIFIEELKKVRLPQNSRASLRLTMQDLIENLNSMSDSTSSSTPENEPSLEMLAPSTPEILDIPGYSSITILRFEEQNAVDPCMIFPEINRTALTKILDKLLLPKSVFIYANKVKYINLDQLITVSLKPKQSKLSQDRCAALQKLASAYTKYLANKQRCNTAEININTSQSIVSANSGDLEASSLPQVTDAIRQEIALTQEPFFDSPPLIETVSSEQQGKPSENTEIATSSSSTEETLEMTHFEEATSSSSFSSTLPILSDAEEPVSSLAPAYTMPIKVGPNDAYGLHSHLLDMFARQLGNRQEINPYAVPAINSSQVTSEIAPSIFVPPTIEANAPTKSNAISQGGRITRFDTEHPITIEPEGEKPFLVYPCFSDGEKAICIQHLLSNLVDERKQMTTKITRSKSLILQSLFCASLSSTAKKQLEDLGYREKGKSNQSMTYIRLNSLVGITLPEIRVDPRLRFYIEALIRALPTDVTAGVSRSQTISSHTVAASAPPAASNTKTSGIEITKAPKSTKKKAAAPTKKISKAVDKSINPSIARSMKNLRTMTHFEKDVLIIIPGHPIPLRVYLSNGERFICFKEIFDPLANKESIRNEYRDCKNIITGLKEITSEANLSLEFRQRMENSSDPRLINFFSKNYPLKYLSVDKLRTITLNKESKSVKFPIITRLVEAIKNYKWPASITPDEETELPVMNPPELSTRTLPLPLSVASNPHRFFSLPTPPLPIHEATIDPAEFFSSAAVEVIDRASLPEWHC